MSNITEDELKNFIRDISVHGTQNKSIVLYQTCLEKGLVERTALDSQTCDNPKCTSCRSFDENISKIIKEELENKQFISALSKYDSDLKDMQAFKDKYEEVHSKYYTPSIEEFHVGFEYEEKITDDSKFEKIIFSKYHKCCTWGYDNIDFEEAIKRNRIRVKYLDKEDIESLGFIYDEESNNNFYTHKDRRETYLSFFPQQKRIEIGDQENYGSFAGTIKNKSELKKLLTQLNIEFSN